MVKSEIIPIGVSEVHRVADLAHQIWPEAFDGILPADYIPAMVSDIYAHDVLAADINERGHQYWLAMIDGHDVGYVSAYLEKGRVWIKKLYLLSRTRGLGLGKALIATAHEHFGASKPLALFVNDGNSKAIAFYKSQGFEVESHLPVRMGPYDFHDYVMVKPGA
jgi:ribosomal protein S18 acetylase RimI-like enzyme